MPSSSRAAASTRPCRTRKSANLTEDFFKDAEVVHLAAGDRRERLVQQQHPFLGAVGMQEAGAEVGERAELQFGIAVPPRHLHCPPEALLLAPAVGFEHADVERHPADFGRFRRLGREPLRPCQPAAAHRPVPYDRAVYPCQRAGDPHRAHGVARRAIREVRLLPLVDRLPEGHVQIGRAGQALQHFAGR
jgi:hypothetical protein